MRSNQLVLIDTNPSDFRLDDRTREIGRKGIVVGDTDREAQGAAKRAFLQWYDALIHLWRAHGVGLPRQLIPAEFEDALAQGYIIAGSASTVRERMKKDNEIAGINYSLCRLAFGDLSFEESARSVELFAKEVMPAL